MNLFLYTNATAATGKVLAEALGFRAAQSYAREARPAKLIRWGSSTGISRKAEQTLNKKAAISLAINKLTSMQRFGEAGIPHPDIISLTNGNIPHGFVPALARNINHTRGSDIILCLQHKDLVEAAHQGRSYAIKYVPTAVEYRIHVFGGEVIKISEKVLINRDNYLPWLRNFEHGYAFRNPQRNPTNLIKVTAASAVEALGLDFGAVDLIVSDRGMPYVLEVNTGPGLVRSTAEHYVRKFKESFALPDDQINLDVLDRLNENHDEE